MLTYYKRILAELPRRRPTRRPRFVCPPQRRAAPSRSASWLEDAWLKARARVAEFMARFKAGFVERFA